MTRVLPLPAPARMRTGPSVVSTAARCCGLSWSRKDKTGDGSKTHLQFYMEDRSAIAGRAPLLLHVGHCLHEAVVVDEQPERVVLERIGQGLSRDYVCLVLISEPQFFDRLLHALRFPLCASQVVIKHGVRRILSQPVLECAQLYFLAIGPDAGLE